MKKILLLSIMLILCSTMRATVYTFVTSGGTFKIYKESNLISFNNRFHQYINLCFKQSVKGMHYYIRNVCSHELFLTLPAIKQKHHESNCR